MGDLNERLSLILHIRGFQLSCHLPDCEVRNTGTKAAKLGPELEYLHDKPPIPQLGILCLSALDHLRPRYTNLCVSNILTSMITVLEAYSSLSSMSPGHYCATPR